MNNTPKILCICNQKIHANLHTDLLQNSKVVIMQLENHHDISIIEKIDGLIVCNNIQSSLKKVDPNILQNNIFRYVLDHNLPLVAISQGMISLNNYLQKTKDPKQKTPTVQLESKITEAFITPGSRLAKSLSTMGVIKVSSPQIPILTEHQKDNSLLTSAYSTKNRSVLAFESMFHKWVLGISFDLNSSEKINAHIYKMHSSLINQVINP